MGKGRKKIPTKLKEAQGTIEKSRLVENEMQVDACRELPASPVWLSEIGKSEWYKVTNQLFNLQMLHQIDLPLIAAYCNEISLYIETETMLREKGRIQVFKNIDGTVKHTQAIPYQKIAKDALDKALKLAVQFGLTPVARASINAPKITNNTQINYFD
ncbi:MAG: phage terminase small subunit P27 family [Flavobacteriales bacterium]|nr:phage terminase small subunit P27 family [Flavobacteriales bacterium]